VLFEDEVGDDTVPIGVLEGSGSPVRLLEVKVPYTVFRDTEEVEVNDVLEVEVGTGGGD
jgi:hypothetical protein